MLYEKKEILTQIMNNVTDANWKEEGELTTECSTFFP